MVDRRMGLDAIDIGGYGSPRGPVVLDFWDHGVNVTDATISKIRALNTSGERIEIGMRCYEVRQTGSVPEKSRFYFDIADAGFRLRKTYVGYLSHRFSSQGFTDELAADQHLKPQILRQLFRTMRADLVYAERHGLNTDVFKLIAAQYVEDFTTPTRYAYPLPLELRNRRLSNSAAEFYRLLYQFDEGLSMSTWIPYEAEVFQWFYEKQLQRGGRLTILDRMVLDHYRRTPLGNQAHIRYLESFAERVRKDTDIKVDSHTVTLHRNVLIGRPLNKFTIVD